jgi:hypothetical protein
MSTVFKLTRIFRHFVDGVPQISDFQDDPPKAATPLGVRIKHFTEIENFAFLGYTLAHELGGGLARISTIQDLVVPDPETQQTIDGAKNLSVTDERLGDELLDVGINWEHFVASNNDKMDPADPLKVTDAPLQALIDSLDLLSEALVAEVNLRAMKHKKDKRKVK